MRILSVTSENRLKRKIKRALKDEFIVDFVDSGSLGIYSAQEEFYSLILLDTSLSDMSGIDLCSMIRKRGVTIPIIIISDKGCSSERISCLRQGADAYIPMDQISSELSVSIIALLRRISYSYPTGDIYKIGNFNVDFCNHQVLLNGKDLKFKKKEYALLELFLRNKGRVLSRNVILEAVWEDGEKKESNVVSVNVYSLRQKLEQCLNTRNLIRTVYGLGYVFEDTELQQKE